MMNKKERTAQAIARARAWAEKRRNAKTGGGSGNSSTITKRNRQQHTDNKHKIAILQAMLLKERQLLAEAQMKVQLIENELKKIAF